jgi:hypothetical protein
MRSERRGSRRARGVLSAPLRSTPSSAAPRRARVYAAGAKRRPRAVEPQWITRGRP